MADHRDGVEVVHPGAAEGAVAGREAGRLDDVHIEAEAGGEPEDRSSVLSDIRLEGTTFDGVPLNLELKLEVWDSPNSAGVVIDAIRCAKLALDRGIGGPLNGPASYFMKSPPIQLTDDEARRSVEAFIEANATAAATAATQEDVRDRLYRG